MRALKSKTESVRVLATGASCMRTARSGVTRRWAGRAILAARGLFGLWLGLAGLTSAWGERYLSFSEAQRLCFPEADRFVESVEPYSPGERSMVGQKAGVRVVNMGNRVARAFRGTNVLGVVVLDQVLGKHELIDYAVALTPSGEVRQIEVLEYRESHGSEIRGAKWRGQFQGKNAEAKLKLHEDIYNLSGATISCRQVTAGVRRVLASYELVLRSRFGWMGGGLPDSPRASIP
ncbi:MAG: FMN-binding protein [Verrucomicrobia bacterium]|nr:FMN-binding protein [Verrucomicrobiota bacterium]